MLGIPRECLGLAFSSGYAPEGGGCTWGGGGVTRGGP